MVAHIVDFILLLSCMFILGGSIFISIKTRFVQLRAFKMLYVMLTKRPFWRTAKESSGTVTPTKALFTAMSTTLGLSTIVAPVIAMQLGGPGALLFFLLTAFFGSAATFIEVNLSLQHRKRLQTGLVMGGPMQYLEHFFSKGVAKWYACACFALMLTWSGAQANQVSAILNSPLLGCFRVPLMVSGAIIALFTLILLKGGIKRIGAFSQRLVPVMFLLYVGGCIWILLHNVHQFVPVMMDVFRSAFSPIAIESGTLVGGITATLRWGILKGIQSCEAGIGTQAIPHSMAETEDPQIQGALSMVSTYSAGVLAFLSGFVTLVTNTWQASHLPLGIDRVAAAFELFFPHFGIALLIVCALLFGFGTILGNSFNGGHCFAYLTSHRYSALYLACTTAMIFFGAISDVVTFWSFMDLVLALMAIPHMCVLLLYVAKRGCFPAE